MMTPVMWPHRNSMCFVSSLDDTCFSSALVLSNLIYFSFQYEYFLLLHMSKWHSLSTRQLLLKFTYQVWRVSGYVYGSYRHRGYLYSYICIIFTTCLPHESLMRTYVISICHKQRYFYFQYFWYVLRCLWKHSFLEMA